MYKLQLMSQEVSNALSFYVNTGNRVLATMQERFPMWEQMLKPYCNAIHQQHEQMQLSLTEALIQLLDETEKPSIKATLMGAWRHMMLKQQG